MAARVTGPGVSLEPVPADRDLEERLLHGRVLTCCERVERAGSALHAAAEAEALGQCSPDRVDWQEAVLLALQAECAHGAR